MNTLNEILLNSTDGQRDELKMYIDRTIPSEIIELRLDMLKNRDSDSLINLLKINHNFKMYLLAEVTLVEDMLATAIYKSEFGLKTCAQIIGDNAIFPKSKENTKRKAFVKIIKDKAKMQKKDFNEYTNKTFFEIFNNSTLGGKILIIACFDHGIISNLITSKNKKYTKKDLINALEYSKRIRNHVAHNFFILNKGPYLRMVPDNTGYKTDTEKIEYLFYSLEKILNFSSRGKILVKIKAQINRQKNSKNKKEMQLNKIDSILLK